MGEINEKEKSRYEEIIQNKSCSMHVINSILPGRWLKIMPIHVWICLCMCMTIPCRGQEVRAASVAVSDTATDRVVARIVFIGDAGRINANQQAVIRQASKEVIPGRTKVLFLGDNVFPAGFDGDNANDQTNGATTLSAAYLPFRQLGAAVYFIPGEKDWDNGGPEGLNKVKQAAAFIAAKHDSLLTWLPPEGCPDPVLIPVTDQLVIIAMDSEWWLQLNKKNKEDAGSDCNCYSSQDITANLRELLYKNRYKTILLATHHPFASYGTHGGNFSWKDYIFPLTAIQKDLYLPIPVVGALYPALRKTFQGPQDLHHPLYTQMRQMVTEVFEGFPNLIHVSAHEEGLQFINNPKKQLVQIISGGGSEAHYTTRGSSSLFAAASIGFVTLDQLSSGAIRIRFLGQADKAQTKKSEKISVNPADTRATGSSSEEGSLVELFAYQYHPKPYRQLEKRHQEAMTADSLKLAVHPAYNQVTGAHRLLFGDNYRSQWATPVQLPVIHVSEYAGGLRPVKLGGGFQSTSLRLADKDGKEYTLRSVEKRADLIVPEAFSGTFVKEWLDDATSAQHPYAALIVPPLANAVSVAHAVPIVGVVAPDSALAAYGALFDGKVNLLEAREPIGETDNTVKTARKLQEDNDNNFDAKAFLRARGLDYLMSDWDRHEDQWRFHDTSKKGEPDYYIPVPRDRDMVLNVTEGLIPDIAKHFILMPRVFGFSRKDPLRGSNYYFYKSAFLNQHPSAQFNFDTWHKIAVDEQAALTDSVLITALMQLPPEIRKIDYSALLGQLKNRRDHLTAAMDKYYRLTNKYVDIEASDKKELVTISDDNDQNALRITLQKISKKGKIQDTLMSKIYPREITKEIRLYLGRGDDSVIINNRQSTVGLRLIGGHGHKSYNITSAHRKIRVYDHEREAYYGDTDRLKINVK
ncbi:MAG TPA: hypothetical protein VL053_10105, partial [Arachidicoccus sp.]|nr:hypothetical protein [Arachidicoccus sp.]